VFWYRFTMVRLGSVVIALAICSCNSDYAKKAKTSEASLNLESIARRLKTRVIEKDQFPIGSTGLTPSTDCCSTGGKCKPNPAQWQVGVWKELEFHIDEEHRFQYSYESSDGKTFTVKAVGCGDLAGTWSFTGSTEAGHTKFTEISGPP
jgi:hypothetical protein